MIGSQPAPGVRSGVKCVQMQMQRVRRGTIQPGEETIDIGASGNIKTYVLSFKPTVAAGSEEEIWFSLCVPDDIDADREFQFGLLMKPKSTWAAGNYVWKCDYLVKDKEGGDFTTGTPTTISKTITVSTAKESREVLFDDTVSASFGQFVAVRMYLHGDSTATVDAHVIFAGTKYTSNKNAY